MCVCRCNATGTRHKQEKICFQLAGFEAGRDFDREGLKGGSANHSTHAATAHYFGGLAGMLASLENVSLLNQNTDNVAVCFIQHPNNIGDGQFVIREEIADGHLPLGDFVKSI